MSRTYRKIPGRLNKFKQENNFLRKIKNGLFSIPINVNTDGFAYENVWKREAKRFWKRYLTKKNRRKNQEVSNDR